MILCEANTCEHNKAGECKFSGHLYLRMYEGMVYCAVYELQTFGGELSDAERGELPSGTEESGE